MITPDKDSLQILTTDFLVLGSGVAGIRAAITLAQKGSVLIVNKGTPPQSASEVAQGGIAAAMDGRDSVEDHLNDTLKAGKGLSAPDAVKVLVREGPERIYELIDWGARFDQEGDRFLYAFEAGHRTPRILRAHGDSSGNEIVRTLLLRAGKNPSIKWLNRHFTVDLLVENGRCAGALMISAEGSWVAVRSRAVVLATGGMGQLYLRTTNPGVATGDGMAMAYRAGAILEDMEFVQFHPTCLALPNAPAFLLTEAMRGEGAVLRGTDGKPFMEKYDPAGDLATRDVVSRAIAVEMEESASPHLFLDATHLDSSFLRKRFPTVTQTCLQYGLDITKVPVPISPAAHFMIGGPKTDVGAQTSLRDLFAAGEVACSGVHGANRLASNSLLEGLVFGARAGETIVGGDFSSLLKAGPFETLVREYLEKTYSRPEMPEAEIRNLKSLLKKTMWECAGIIRNGKALEKGLEKIKTFQERFPGGIHSQDEGELVNLITVAFCVARGAALRTKSLGVHFRSDDKGPAGPGRKGHIRFERWESPEGYFSYETR